MSCTNNATYASNTSSSTTTTTSSQRTQALNSFLASDTIVTIIPSFTYHRSPNDFLLTHTSLAPFQAGIESTVPLWMAIHLRKRNLCRLKCPEWMQVDNLKDILRFERQPENYQLLSKDLPFCFVEISNAILQACGAGRSGVHAFGGLSGNEEVPQAELVRLLLEDIQMVRMEKIRKSIHLISAVTMVESVDKPLPSINVTGMGSMEMAAIKPFLERAFQDHFKLVRTGLMEDNNGGTGGASSRSARVLSRRNRTLARRRRGTRTRGRDQDRDGEEVPHEFEGEEEEEEEQDDNDEDLDDDDEDLDDDDDMDDEEDLEEPTADVTADAMAGTTTDTTTATTTRSNIRRYRS